VNFMEISNSKITEAAIAAAARVKSVVGEAAKPDAESIKISAANKQEPKDVNVNAEDLQEMTEALNKFMQSMNADLKFTVHDKTQQLMVQLIDIAEQKVLKEFPPRDFLDMVAKIREYVGALLDKRV